MLSSSKVRFPTATKSAISLKPVRALGVWKHSFLVIFTKIYIWGEKKWDQQVQVLHLSSLKSLSLWNKKFTHPQNARCFILFLYQSTGLRREKNLFYNTSNNAQSLSPQPPNKIKEHHEEFTEPTALLALVACSKILLILGLLQCQINMRQKVFQPLWYLERPLVLIWNHPITAWLKEGKQGKPDTSALGILLH